MKRLFHNVVWPAVAGNVAWAFFTVLEEAKWCDQAFWIRLASLMAVGVYLAADWCNTDAVFSEINPKYWVADAFLAPALAVFAIATQAHNSWSAYAIAFAFAAAIVGHRFGAWDKASKAPSPMRKRYTLAGINASGLVILGAGACLGPPYMAWSIPVAITLVVTIFLAYEHYHH